MLCSSVTYSRGCAGPLPVLRVSPSRSAARPQFVVVAARISSSSEDSPSTSYEQKGHPCSSTLHYRKLRRQNAFKTKAGLLSRSDTLSLSSLASSESISLAPMLDKAETWPELFAVVKANTVHLTTQNVVGVMRRATKIANAGPHGSSIGTMERFACVGVLHLLSTRSQTDYQHLDAGTTSGMLACMGLLAARGVVTKRVLPMEVLLMVASLLSRVRQCWNGMSGGSHSHVIRAAALLLPGNVDMEWLAEWESSSYRHLGSLSGPHLACQLWSLAQLADVQGYKPRVEWLGRCTEALLPLLPSLSSSELADTIHSLSLLQHRPSEQWLQSFATVAAARQAELDPAELALVLLAMNNMEVPFSLLASAGRSRGGAGAAGLTDQAFLQHMVA